MLVIIAPAAGENWLVPDLAADTPVETLRAIVAEKLLADPAKTKVRSLSVPTTKPIKDDEHRELCPMRLSALKHSQSQLHACMVA
jgi:putative SOS response-associated peptidase YedK